MKATAEIQIDKPIDDVWAFVSNIENMDRWVDGIEAPKQTSESETGKGTTFYSKYNYRGKSFDMVRLRSPRTRWAPARRKARLRTMDTWSSPRAAEVR